jgi:hypothetical protein
MLLLPTETLGWGNHPTSQIDQIVRVFIVASCVITGFYSYLEILADFDGNSLARTSSILTLHLVGNLPNNKESKTCFVVNQPNTQT